jgi:hypothetical protein
VVNLERSRVYGDPDLFTGRKPFAGCSQLLEPPVELFRSRLDAIRNQLI